jgi:50S ribosomal subunit-associated GTPase HflX
VVDASAPEEELVEMTRAVEDVLEEIGAGDKPRLLVLNKADVLDEDAGASSRSAMPTASSSRRSPARAWTRSASGSRPSSSAR